MLVVTLDQQACRLPKNWSQRGSLAWHSSFRSAHASREIFPLSDIDIDSGVLPVISSSLLGFTSHFYQLVLLWGLEGVFNGNVATARTVITEIVGEAK